MPVYDRWILPPDHDTDSAILSGLQSPVIRRIFAARGVTDEESFRRFTSPALEHLHDPAAIHGMDYACNRIERAIRDREPILIYGDYDVDGITSIVLLRTVLRTLGADVDFVIPHRMTDGYGLKTSVLDRVTAERPAKLVITVDCGITSIEPVADAIERGIDVIVTDHHLPPGTLPAAAAVLNPRQPGCNYPFKDLAGVGVAFKLCCALIGRSSKKISIASLIKIAAIGTIADVAPLTGENRTIVQLGLDGLQDPRNPGLRMLLRVLGLEGKPVRAMDVGFKIGPRLNAAGRLESAEGAIRLFSARTDQEAWDAVMDLNRVNAQRQSVLDTVLKEATERVPDPLPSIIILADEHWHKGVLGLCASRIAEKFNRPALLMTREGSHMVGSGRSIEGVDLHHRLSLVSHLFTHFGGHEYACGFSLPAANLGDLTLSLQEEFSRLPVETWRREIQVDAELTLGDLSAGFFAEHQRLEPFGAGNRQPSFVIRGVRCTGAREFSPDCVEVVLETASGARSTGVIWPSCRQLVRVVKSGEDLGILVRLEPDRRAPEGWRLEIRDAVGNASSFLRRNEKGPAYVFDG